MRWPGQVWKGRVNNELKKVQDSYSSSIAACLLQKKEVKMKKIVVGRLGGAQGCNPSLRHISWDASTPDE